MTSPPPADLPESWPADFGEEEREYLYEESRQRLQEVIEFANQQEAKALALVRISLVIIAASGIFGDLRIESASPLEWGPVSIVSALALLASVVVGGIAFWLLHPQAWWTGADVHWLARWAGASKRELKDIVLETLVTGFHQNRAITRKRGSRLVLLLWAVAVQTLVSTRTQSVCSFWHGVQ